MTASAPPPHQSRSPKRDTLVAALCGGVVALMIGASFAAVPFYNWFCRTTGFGGTPQVATAAPAHTLARRLAIRFDSNVAPGLPWHFVPEQNEINVRIGEVVTVYYKVVNQTARAITAQATYNVSPPTVGAYFTKVNCFCFTRQTLQPGETREMAVVFYVDPAIVKDSDQDHLNTITLSYTFFRLPDSQPVAEAPRAALKKL